jgi:hypothetical protein
LSQGQRKQESLRMPLSALAPEIRRFERAIATIPSAS